VARRSLPLMSLPRVPRDKNLTLRVDADVVLWARARAWFGGTSVNALTRNFLAEYAAVPDRWRQGLPPPWTSENRIRPVMDPVGAGLRAAGLDSSSGAAIEAIAEASE
jgi:hypothetical protein